MYTRNLKAGHPFFITHGEYSDYSVDGFFLPLEDIPAERMLAIAAEVQAEWNKEDEEKGWAGDVREMLVPALIKRGLLLQITAPEIHIGGWDELKVEDAE